MADEVPDPTPLRVDPAVSEAHVSLHAVLVRNGHAQFDDAAVHGQGDVLRGIRWVESRDRLRYPEHWTVVWVAVTHAADGSRAYTGLVAEPLWIDVRTKRGVREGRWENRRLAETTHGRVALDALPARDRAALWRALVSRDPDAWDRAPDVVQRAAGAPRRRGA